MQNGRIKYLKATSGLTVTVVTVGYSAVTPLKVASNLTVTEVTHFFDVLLIYILLYYYYIYIYIIIIIFYRLNSKKECNLCNFPL